MKYGPLVLIFFVACTAIADCNLDANSNQFFISFNQEELTQFTFQSVTNNLSDSIYFDADSTFRMVALPVTETAAGLTYLFETDTATYRLTLSYDQQVTIYGEDCPASILFSNLQVLDHNFDSVAITNDILTSRTEENIEVYF